MPTRRKFLASCVPLYSNHAFGASFVNDIHSQLNRTSVARIASPRTLAEIQDLVRAAKSARQQLSIAGGRHAMGGQQFGQGTVLVDTQALTRLLNFDREAGTLEVEAGAFWPGLISAYTSVQQGHGTQWSIAQKQTGADRISIGGTLAANAHGRGLTMKPFVGDIESFKLVDAGGNLLTCDRKQNAELFRLAIGGYGLFGIVYSVTLRLVPRQKIMRIVEVRDTKGLIEAFSDRIRNGFVYGDFQFSIDKSSDDFLHRGVFSCYQPVDPTTPIPETKELSDENWRTLL